MKAIDWNTIEDEMDIIIWNRLTEQFWLPEKIATSLDIPSWSTLTAREKEITSRVLGGLTLLDTMQSFDAAPALLKDAKTPHEQAVLMNIGFMEAVHSKSYSSIFASLCTSEENLAIHRWVQDNPRLQYKAKVILEAYNGDCPIMRKAASVLLESFLFYSGFYLLLYWSGAHSKLTNTADIIRLIMRDEALHGYYIGYKFQKEFALLSDDEKKIKKDAIYDLLTDLYENEEKYTEELYDDMRLSEDVKRFVRYNGNKALANLGFEPLFPEESTNVSAVILSAVETKTQENHDFFSGSGSTYLVGTVEAMSDSDWDDWE